MEFFIGTSNKFKFYVESQQTTQSPEDILIEVEEETGVRVQDLDGDSFKLLTEAHTKRCINWR